MGEAKRRKQLDPDFGQSNVLRNACKHIDDLLLQQEKTQSEPVSIFSLFTNNDRGCDDDELDLLQSTIPSYYHNESFTVWILPKKHASSNVQEALPYFVPLHIGDLSDL